MSELTKEMPKKLGFGCMRLPVTDGSTENINDAAFCEMIDSYIEQGFKYFDTAYPYHNGRSEEAVGRCLVQRYARDRFFLASKMPVWLVKEYADYGKYFEEQLKKCQVESFDFYLLHAMNKDRVKEAENLGGFQFVQSMKAEGKIRHIGFSFHDKADVLDEILTNHPEMEFVQLQINYYDAEIFDQVMKRLQADKNAVSDTGNFEKFDKYRKKKHTDLKTWFREFNRYHGLPKQDAVFFNMSDLICELAKSEDCVIMGRCADAILKNNHIPHISLFISAPFQVRVQHVMDIRNMNLKQAVRFLKQMDKHHKKYYEFYTGEKWGKPENYDLCINSANYGLKDTIELIQRMLDQKVH